MKPSVNFSNSWWPQMLLLKAFRLIFENYRVSALPFWKSLLDPVTGGIVGSQYVT